MTDNKTKLSLQDIYNNFLNEVPISEHSYIRKYGFVLIISLSGAEQKSSKKGAYTLAINNGYITEPVTRNPETITVPFLVSWKGWGLQQDVKGKVQLIEFDDYSRNVDDENLKEKLKGIPIRWKFNLSGELLKTLLSDNSIREYRAWQNFKKFLCNNSKSQIQMLIVKPVEPQKGAGKLETIRLDIFNNTKEVYTIDISKSDILAAKLIIPGNEFIDKVDRPKTVMKPLEGRVVEEDEPITVVTWDQALKKSINNNYAKLTATVKKYDDEDTSCLEY
ncbi:MAG: hypothetical protein HC815_27550 [Richelia sp. RM1_1_1]|nr:hypothetical protein [Richelia sp. RM1_1_1]